MEQNNFGLVINMVVNKKRHAFDVYIGRGSIWGNPYRIGVDGTRAEVIEKYEVYIRNNSKLLKKLHLIQGMVLGCYCKPLPCHGDVLIKLIEEGLVGRKEGKTSK